MMTPRRALVPDVAHHRRDGRHGLGAAHQVAEWPSGPTQPAAEVWPTIQTHEIADLAIERALGGKKILVSTGGALVEAAELRAEEVSA